MLWQLLRRMKAMRMGTAERVERRAMGTAMRACLGRRSCKACSNLGLETMMVRGYYCMLHYDAIGA